MDLPDQEQAPPLCTQVVVDWRQHFTAKNSQGVASAVDLGCQAWPFFGKNHKPTWRGEGQGQLQERGQAGHRACDHDVKPGQEMPRKLGSFGDDVDSR